MQRLFLRVPRVALVCVFSLAATSCAPLLVSIGLGLERGKADVDVKTDSAGTVFFERRPRQPRAAVVLVHGFGGSKDHWTRFIAELPDDLLIVAPDLWGFGESKRDERESFDLHTQSKRLQRFLDERGIQQYHLIGSSMGGQLSARHALNHPGDVLSLVMFNPGGIQSPVPSPMDEFTKRSREPFPIANAADFDRLLQLSFVVQPRIPDVVKGYFAEQAALGLPFQRKIKDDLWEKPAPMIDAARDLEPPTLVVWGDGDKVLDPSLVPVWRDIVPGGLVVVMRDTGHGPMLERPAEAAQLVLTWWSRVFGTGGARASPNAAH